MISRKWQDLVMNVRIRSINGPLDRFSRCDWGIPAISVILALSFGRSQAQELPPSPVPVTQQPSAPVAPTPPVPVGPQPGPYGPVQPGFVPPPPPPPQGLYSNPYQDHNGPLLRGDPLLEPIP